MFWRTSFGAILLLAAVAAAAVPAAAQQQACLTLEAQLAALDRQNPATVYQNLLAQYSQLRGNYDQLRAQAGQMGCIRLFQFNVPPSCSAINSQLEALTQQLNQLSAQLQAANPNQSTAARTNILRALAANNCGPQYAPYAAPAIGQGGLLDRLFGPQTGGTIGPAPITVATYRTVCARPCDGYFFPISFSTTPSRFETDRQTCLAQCPGAELYVYENPGGAIEEAATPEGRFYTELPNAFAYRVAYHPECGCEPVTPIRAAGDPPYTPIPPESARIIAELTAAVPLPVPRPDPSEDPETIANRLGGFTVGPFTLGGEMLAAPMLVNDEGQRLVGPAYLYAQ